jgi:hypothetical protein
MAPKPCHVCHHIWTTYVCWVLAIRCLKTPNEESAVSITRIAGYGAALLIGALAGFFLVFNILFTDVSSTNERLYSFLLTIVVYLVLGAIFGYLMATWHVGLVLSLVAVVLALLYSAREPGNLPLHLAYILATLAAACGGAYAGARVKTRAKTMST